MMTAVGGVGVACEDGVNLSVRGSSATNSSAMESAGRFDTGKPGRAAMSRESRAVASSRDNRARPMASSQGSTPDCASAEITVSGCPCRPSPIEANKNGSNSRPMPGASAACVMPSTHSVWRRSWKELARLPESSARDEETNRLPGALRLELGNYSLHRDLSDQVARAICSAQKLIATSTDMPRKPSAAPTKLPTTGMI